MASTRIVSVIGRKNAGKTTLTVALASELVRRGHRVMTIKHGHHPADADRKGSDTWRHFHEGRAERVLIASPDLRVLFERSPDDYDPIALAQQYMHGADIVLTEGYKQAPLPKIEVFRKTVADAPIASEHIRAARRINNDLRRQIREVGHLGWHELQLVVELRRRHVPRPRNEVHG